MTRRVAMGGLFVRVISVCVFVMSAGGCASSPRTGAEDVSPRLASAATGESEEWYLRVDDECTLYVKEFGHGRPLLVLHGGWGAEHSYLLDVFQGLDSDYRLIFYDQRGSLRSPCPDSLISVQHHVSDLERLRLELDLDAPVIVAHSMGSFLAMSYLESHPDRVGGLVLFGTPVPSTPRSEEEAALSREQEGAFVAFARAAQARQISQEGLDRDDLTEKERTYRWRIGFASGNLVHVDRWRQIRGGMVFYNQDAGRAAGRSMPQEWDFLPALRKLSHPVTMINGDHDLLGFGGRLHQQMLEDLPNVEFVMLERAGHNAWVDQPERFREALLRALGKYQH
ncbi:MAG: alpha/beta hydrolase [Thioalkalivibrio sp.]|nr:alpha/beta hydrolase [Thioalkalivibrio sp.]